MMERGQRAVPCPLRATQTSMLNSSIVSHIRMIYLHEERVIKRQITTLQV